MINLCASYRAKNLYGNENVSDADLHTLLGANEVQCTCLQTAGPVGPDDDLVAPELCHPNRACFRPSPKRDRGLV